MGQLPFEEKALLVVQDAQQHIWEELAEFDEKFAAGAGVGVRREEFGGLEKGFDLEEGRFSACGFFDLLDEAKD